MIPAVFMFLFTYVFGSINFPIYLFRIMGKGDPRSQFSGNPGATNVYRQMGIQWALVVLLLDMGRGALVAVIALTILPTAYVTWMGLGLIIGNRFPCFHQFKGGKGVANFLGFTVVIIPVFTIVSVIGWGIAFAVTRAPFIGSFLMVFILIIGTVLRFWGYPIACAGSLLTAGTIYCAHKKNIIQFMGKT